MCQRTDRIPRCSDHRRTVKTLLLAPLFLLLAAAGASAQTIVTKVDLEGHPAFSDRRDAAAQSQQDAAPAPEAPPVRRFSIARERSAAINVKEAERRLAQAQQKRQEGMEPLPGELNPETGQPNFRYWKRQEKLRQNVEVAQRRVIATRQPKHTGSVKQSQSASSRQSQM